MERMMAKNNIYWIGGAPCSGKSTVADMLVKEYGFKYYKVDNHLDRYLDIGAKKGNKVLKAMKERDREATWLGNDIDVMVEEEFVYYKYALKIIEGDLKRQFGNKKVVVEGAAIIPEYAKTKEIAEDRYVCIVPTRSFQSKEFAERGYVTRLLGGTSDPDKALENWLERDARFAQIVRDEAIENEQNLIIVDGQQSAEEVYAQVRTMFGLPTTEVKDKDKDQEA